MNKPVTSTQKKPGSDTPVFSAAALKRVRATKISGRLSDAIKYLKAETKEQ